MLDQGFYHHSLVLHSPAPAPLTNSMQAFVHLGLAFSATFLDPPVSQGTKTLCFIYLLKL